MDSEAGGNIGFRGIAVSLETFRTSGIDQPSISLERAHKLIESTVEVKREKSSLVATMRKLAGKLRPAQSSAGGRFGRTALRQSTAGKRGKLSFWGSGAPGAPETTLPHVAPRVICSADLNKPPRVYSDAAGSGGMASIAISGKLEKGITILLSGQADKSLGSFTNRGKRSLLS